jgi:nicotinamidase-related amidase
MPSLELDAGSTAREAHECGYEQVFVEDAMAAREADVLNALA